MRYFSETEIAKNVKKYRRNKIKAQAYEEYVNELNEKNQEFEETWARGMKIARQVFGFTKKTDKDYLNQPFSKLVSGFIREYLLFPDSIMETFNKTEGKSPKERFFNATSKIYQIRTTKFMTKYGDRNVKFNNETHTLKEWLEIYKIRGITKDEMNEIIKFFKDHDDEFLSQTYKSRDYEHRQSIE